MSNHVDTATNLPPFSLPQTVYMISLASNFLFNRIGEKARLLAEIQEYLGVPGKRFGAFFQTMNVPSARYQCLACPPGSAGPADWQVAWGPALFEAWDNIGATNTAFVAYSAKLNTYVVAIAGTNPVGANAMLFQDLDVNPAHMVAWRPTVDRKHVPPRLIWEKTPHPKSDKPALAKGTSEGVSRLYELQGTSIHDPDKAVTLEVFLESVANTSATLIFTGHSLGGALSPMLALLLYPEPSKSRWANVYILATAGPTPGNQALANLFADPKAYPRRAIAPYEPAGTQGGFARFTDWNVNYANDHDLVPRAWDRLVGIVEKPGKSKDPWPCFFSEEASLKPIPGLEVFTMLAAMEKRAGYTDDKTPYYAPALPQVSFSGQWGKWGPSGDGYPPVWKPDVPPAGGMDLKAFVNDTLNAHLPQYPFAFLGANAPAQGAEDGFGGL